MHDGRRLDDVQRGRKITIQVDGVLVDCHEGETLVAALMAAGCENFRLSSRLGLPRAPYCNMGVCFDCMVVVDGCAFVRACMTDVVPGIKVQTGKR